MNEIRLKAYGFSMEAVGSKKFIAQEREAFLDFTEEKVSKAAMKLSGNDARAEVHSQEVRNRENAEHGEDLVTITHKTTQPISLEWIRNEMNACITKHISMKNKDLFIDDMYD